MNDGKQFYTDQVSRLAAAEHWMRQALMQLEDALTSEFETPGGEGEDYEALIADANTLINKIKGQRAAVRAMIDY
jgi:hypothetical protein